MARSTPRKASVSRVLLRIAGELAVIFAGVYGAFWVEGYRQELEDRERAGKILGALEAELSVVVDFGPVAEEAMSAQLHQWQAAREGGETPPPAYYRESGAETPSTSVWDATLASGGVNVLDSELFFGLAAYYNRLESLSERYLRYNAFTEREILPLLSRGPEAFYDPRTKELDPAFAVHMDQLEILRDEVAVLVDQAATLRDRVREEKERLR